MPKGRWRLVASVGNPYRGITSGSFVMRPGIAETRTDRRFRTVQLSVRGIHFEVEHRMVDDSKRKTGCVKRKQIEGRLLGWYSCSHALDPKRPLASYCVQFTAHAFFRDCAIEPIETRSAEVRATV